MQSTIVGKQSADFKPLEKSHDGTAAIVFFGLAGLFLLAICYTAFNLASVVSYERDIWHHLAVYRELIASPFNALNPHVATDDPSRSFSPWTVSVALAARAFGGDAFTAIAISAIGSTTSILLGIYLFSKEYWRNAWAPALLLITFFGTWVLPVNHTGYHTIATFLYSISYPFGIVLGAGFITWWLALKGLTARAGLPVICVAMIALSAAMFITHQLQGLFAVGAALSFALFAGQATITRRVILGVCLLGGLFVSQFWMYFDPVAYVLNPEVRKGHDAVRFLNYSLDNIPYILATIGLAILGLLGLVDARTMRPRYELLLAFIVVTGGFLFLLVKGNWVNVRIVPFVVLYLQLGLVSYLVAERAPGAMGQVGKGIRALIIMAIAFGLVINVQNGKKAYDKSRTFLTTGQIDAQPITWSRDILAASDFAETLVPAGSTVIAHLQTAFPMEATSLKVVAIPRLFAEVADMRERQANNRAFFDIGTDAATRCEILAKYDVKMITYRGYWLDDAVKPVLDMFGTRHDEGDMTFVVPNGDTFTGCDAQ